jgi:hypothetical protein
MKKIKKYGRINFEQIMIIIIVIDSACISGAHTGFLFFFGGGA